MWKQLLVESCLKSTLRYPSKYDFSPQTMRHFTGQIAQVFPCNKQGLNIDTYSLANLTVEKITPLNNTSKHIILYLHGGGFCLGSLKTHRAWLCEMARTTGTTVMSLAYPLAPETTFPAQSEAIYNAYRALLESGIQAQDIILAGDDAGANLALALCLRLIRQKNTALPCGLMLLSPFVDLTLTSNSVRYNQKHDALVSVDFLKKAIGYYLKDTDFETSDPRVSPLFDDLTGLPPLLIQVGSKSLLMDDAKRLKDMAERAEVDVYYKLYTGMWHNFFMFNAWFDEGKMALNDMCSFIQQRLNQSS
ncbi:alpha/beta hydrolase [Acinetobacter sp. EC24]|nr:alpha/beta hydrolase [Acinetobacter rathckeae]MBF7688246.1 alpha/beta hydrolase [Acinetobacter rathckeae]MBF7695236.1 alpha/beta hydrolase [Acinetobacter rathckeae]